MALGMAACFFDMRLAAILYAILPELVQHAFAMLKEAQS
jgi:hypothetical protein